MPNKLSFTFFLLGTVLLCIGCSAPLGNSSTEKPSITHPATADFRGLLPISPRIIKGQLGNGITYLIRQNGTPEKRAEIRLIVKAGAILEDDNQQGFAHF
jgi:zinc protease